MNSVNHVNIVNHVNSVNSVVELLEIECDLSEYYRQRCIDLASNRLTSRLVNQRSRFLGPGSVVARKKVTIDPELIKLEGDGNFTVQSETKADVSYSVDKELRICSCPHGRLKGPCKHRMLVSLTQNLPSFDLIPESSADMRQMWMFLGTGEHKNIDYLGMEQKFWYGKTKNVPDSAR